MYSSLWFWFFFPGGGYFKTVSHCFPGWIGIHSISQDSLKLPTVFPSQASKCPECRYKAPHPGYHPCLSVICLFISAEDRTQGLMTAKKLLYHLATHLSHSHFYRRQNTIFWNSNLKNFRLHVVNISKRWIFFSNRGNNSCLKTIQNRVKANDFQFFRVLRLWNPRFSFVRAHNHTNTDNQNSIIDIVFNDFNTKWTVAKVFSEQYLESKVMVINWASGIFSLSIPGQRGLMETLDPQLSRLPLARK